MTLQLLMGIVCIFSFVDWFIFDWFIFDQFIFFLDWIRLLHIRRLVVQQLRRLVEALVVAILSAFPPWTGPGFFTAR